MLLFLAGILIAMGIVIAHYLSGTFGLGAWSGGAALFVFAWIGRSIANRRSFDAPMGLISKDESGIIERSSWTSGARWLRVPKLQAFNELQNFGPSLVVRRIGSRVEASAAVLVCLKRKFCPNRFGQVSAS